MKNQTIAGEILAFWCEEYNTTLGKIAKHYEVSRPLLSMLKSGQANLDNASRELRNSFLNIALKMPDKKRSVELDEWIERTEREFEEKPLGAVFLG